ncbi:MAG: c-type cytochrome [Oligoflexia bacterium]|nr:c-type cytochrome [Oligoflexia bacterium]
MAEQDKILDHNYDGIREYDNDLPRWWVAIFWITAIFGVIYSIYFHMPSTPTPEQALAARMDELHAMKPASPTQASGPSEESLLTLAKSTEVLAKGNEVFQSRCAACHMPQGQGLVGPNLTDDYWIHGGKILDIRTTVMEGVPAKGMLSWKTMLTSDDINSVVAFVWSLHGTNPPNAKAPEGQLAPRQ